jgi:hypothetical protein
VGEPVVSAAAGRFDPGLDEVLPAKGVDELLDLKGDVVRDELAQGVLREDETRDRGGFDDRALFRPEQVEARSEKRLDRRRNRDLIRLLHGHPPPVLASQGAFVHHHREHLLDEERVAFSCVHDPGADFGIELCLPEKVLRHARGVVRTQRLEQHDARTGQVLPGGSNVD